MNYIEYHGEGINFDDERVEVKEVKRVFGISGRKSMFRVSNEGVLMRHIPDYIDFTKSEKIVIEAISDFELG